MPDEQIREVLNKHWQASAAGDANAEHDIYDNDAICELSSVRRTDLRAKQFAGPCEVIIQASRRASTSSGFSGKVIFGSRNTQSPTRGGQHTL